MDIDPCSDGRCWPQFLSFAWRVRRRAADSITLTWDPNPPEEAGARLSGVMSGRPPACIPRSTTSAIRRTFIYPNAVAGQEYFFAVVAYNGAGQRSALGSVRVQQRAALSRQPWRSDECRSDKPWRSSSLAPTPTESPSAIRASGLPPGLTLNRKHRSDFRGWNDRSESTASRSRVTDGLLSAQQSFTWFIDGGPPDRGDHVADDTGNLFDAGRAPSRWGARPVTTSASSVVTWANDRGGAGVASGARRRGPLPEVPLKLGDNVITVTARNVVGNTATEVITVTAEQPADAAQPSVIASTRKATCVSLQLAGGDSDGDPITYSVAGLPPGLTLNIVVGADFRHAALYRRRSVPNNARGLGRPEYDIRVSHLDCHEHAADGHSDRHRGEQAVRRDAQRDPGELHAERRRGSRAGRGVFVR